MSTDVFTEARTASRVSLSVLGVVSIIIGVLVLTHPAKTGTAAALFAAIVLGIFAVVAGISYVFSAIFRGGVSFWGRIGRLLIGVLSVIAGVVVLYNPTTSAMFVALYAVIMIGITWIFEGVIAFSEMSQSSSKGWTAFYGVISILAGIAMIVSPFMGAAVILIVIGISAIVWGVTELIAAFTIGK